VVVKFHSLERVRVVCATLKVKLKHFREFKKFGAYYGVLKTKLVRLVLIRTSYVLRLDGLAEAASCRTLRFANSHTVRSCSE
jgi:hypothetical protein